MGLTGVASMIRVFGEERVQYWREASGLPQLRSASPVTRVERFGCAVEYGGREGWCVVVAHREYFLSFLPSPFWFAVTGTL